MKRILGITLVELMVVVAVIGIIIVVTVPAYQEHVRYSDTNKCAKYILGSRLNATNLISIANGSVTGIDAAALGLTNSNSECSGGVTVTEASGVLTIQGSTGTLGAAAASRRFTMTRAAANGAWSCQTTDSGGSVIKTGTCTELAN